MLFIKLNKATLAFQGVSIDVYLGKSFFPSIPDKAVS